MVSCLITTNTESILDQRYIVHKVQATTPHRVPRSGGNRPVETSTAVTNPEQVVRNNRTSEDILAMIRNRAH